MSQLNWTTLKKKLEGDLYTEGHILADYSLDQSILSLKPKAVCHPKSIKDLKNILNFCQENSVEITARGAGSSVSGQSIGRGLIVDFTRYMNALGRLESDATIWVEPGVSLKKLNDYLMPYLKKFAPDPGSSDYCTLGGMFATNAAGPLGIKYGSTKDHVVSFDLMLSDGTIVNSQANSDHEVFYKLTEMVKQNCDAKTIGVKTKKSSSGYNFEALLKKLPSLEQFFSGTEGTLGFITRLQLKAVPLPLQQSLKIFHFDSIETAASQIEKFTKLYQPDALELLDSWILKALTQEYDFFNAFTKTESSVVLIAQWESEIKQNKAFSMDNFECLYEANSDETISQIWAMRKQASPILHKLHSSRKPLRCIEDTAVPIDRLENYIKDLKKILKKYDCDGPIFGHIGMGHIHVNPWIKIESNMAEYLNALMKEVYALVNQYNGVMSAEHGDGILRAPYVSQYQKKLLPLYIKIKKLFDPHNIFNPGKVFGANFLTKEDLRDLNSPWNNILKR